MSLVIRQLHRDHANLAKLLDLLEHQIEVFDSAGTPDYDLMLDIMDYIRNYPVLCHHPKEDLVYRRMTERDPSTLSLVEEALEEHRVLAQVTQEFADALANIVLDSEISRQLFDERARHFIELNRRHMVREEDDLLPRAEAILSESDWEQIDAAITSDDPLFGGAVQDRYLALHQRIVSTTGPA